MGERRCWLVVVSGGGCGVRVLKLEIVSEARYG